MATASPTKGGTSRDPLGRRKQIQGRLLGGRRQTTPAKRIGAVHTGSLAYRRLPTRRLTAKALLLGALIILDTLIFCLESFILEWSEILQRRELA